MVTRNKPSHRNGIAVTELAVGLPLLLVVMMGTVEACTMIRLQQKMKMVAYEGARVGLLPEAMADNVEWQCETLSADQRLNDIVVVLDPVDPRTLDSGDWFTVEVRAPFSSNALMGGWGFGNYDLAESVTLQKP
ncbi:TadE/TadG family type IV pilus assembly protein [Rhodopirellula sp. P2]|uniref:TadE/TadG family type IV pilus assembly protein n=1 Tax=Rhodopirellula sp. P2 TaxID=2127060 RepID=UPI002368A2CE|nr:TadE family protein [Rhodopirellula sp. P2]WDQ15804.1 pilus assembly protein [Rhodopirellula sp. P2]